MNNRRLTAATGITVGFVAYGRRPALADRPPGGAPDTLTMATVGAAIAESVRHADWEQAFVAAVVEARHAGKAMQLVTALTVRSCDDPDPDPEAAATVGLDALCADLCVEGSPVRRNQLVREWLTVHREAVLEHWAALGLPQSPPEPELEPSCDDSVERNRGLVVFDFDLTLAAKNVGIFDLEECTSRTFGGGARVVSTQAILTAPRLPGVALTDCLRF